MADVRLIDADAVLKHFDGYGWGAECDGEIVLDYIVNAPPTVIAYTEDQFIDAFKKVHGLEARNEELGKECAMLKNCLNCKNRKECSRHCGKVVHDCDHWEYGDPVVHGAWDDECRCTACGWYGDDIYKRLALSFDYCPNCGAKMDLEVPDGKT